MVHHPLNPDTQIIMEMIPRLEDIEKTKIDMFLEINEQITKVKHGLCASTKI